LGGEAGVLDLTPVTLNPANFVFETEHGGIVLTQIGSGVYDVHTLFLPEGRGAESAHASAAVCDYMFSHTDCVEARTMVPQENRGALVAAMRSGFQKRYAMNVPWHDGKTDADFLALTLERWALTSDSTAPLGAWFHEQLDAAKDHANSHLDSHEEDVVHNRIVGAVVSLCHGGQVEKAVRFYNIWASCSGYATITLVRQHPAIIDLLDAVVEVRAGSMEVLLCR
jgi:hypothetical protein